MILIIGLCYFLLVCHIEKYGWQYDIKDDFYQFEFSPEEHKERVEWTRNWLDTIGDR